MVLGTRDRSLLLDSLRPPEGYHLRRAVGTTFTLDLMALLTAPLAFTFFDSHDEEGVPISSPLVLLQALRRHAEKITLFCQAGAISVPGSDQPLLAHLEGSVIEVQPQQGHGIFHPKVWFLNFESAENPAIYRVLCLSRNLTFDKAWDTCLRLEGKVMPEETTFERNRPFSEMLRALPEIAIRPTKEELQADIDRMAEEILRVDFQPPKHFEDFRVHYFGLNDRFEWPFPTADRSLAVSPFLIGSTTMKLVEEHGLQVLISRSDALDDVARNPGREALPETCYMLFSGADLDADEVNENEAPEEEEEEAGLETDLVGLHAKLFLFEQGNKAHLFTGSNNATWSAFNRNVEVLVELIGNRKKCGIEAFLGPEDDPRHDTIRSLLEQYRIPEEAPPKPPEEELRRGIGRLAREIAAVPFTARAEDVDENQWDLVLSGSLPEIPEGVTLKIWPVTLPSVRAESVEAEDIGADTPIAAFKQMSLAGLTAFFAFELHRQENGHQAKTRFTVTAELVGAPQDRKERIMRSFLTDHDRVLWLLMLILRGGEGLVGGLSQTGTTRSGGGGGGGAGSWGGFSRETLLESLLRCLSNNPDRLYEIESLVADLRSSDEEGALLPEDLRKILDPVLKAGEGLRK